MLRRVLFATFVALVVLATHRLARADALCATVEKTSMAWYDLVEPLDNKIEKVGAFKIPGDLAAKVRAGIARLAPRTNAIARQLAAEPDARYKRFSVYLPFDLKVLSEIDHKAGDDWDDTSNVIIDDLDRVTKLCEADRR